MEHNIVSTLLLSGKIQISKASYPNIEIKTAVSCTNGVVASRCISKTVDEASEMVRSVPVQKPEHKKTNTPTQTEEEKPLLEIFYEQLSSLRKILCEQLLPAHDAQREEALRCLARDKEEILQMSAPNAPDGYAKSVHEELSEFEANLMLQKKHDETAIKMFNHYDNVIQSMIQEQKNKT